MARRIFREAAVRRYNDRLEKVELPRLATLPWARLWLAIGLMLAVFGGLLWSVEVPIYGSGPGFVTTETPSGEPVVIALLPAHEAPRLAEGQPAIIALRGLPGDAQEVPGRVRQVETRLLSPVAARARFALPSNEPPSPVVVVHVVPDAAALAAAWRGTAGAQALWNGSAADVRVAIGTQSGLALLPGAERIVAEGR